MTSALDKIIEGHRLISEGLAEIHGDDSKAGESVEDVSTTKGNEGGQGLLEQAPRPRTLIHNEAQQSAPTPRQSSNLEGDLQTLKWRKGDRGSEYLFLKDVPQSILNQFQIGLSKTVGTKSYWRSDKYLSRRDAK